MQAGFRESALTQVVHSISSIVIVTNKVSNAYSQIKLCLYKYNLFNLHNKLMELDFLHFTDKESKEQN